MSSVLILGSGPNVVEAAAWPRDGIDHILAINNAHALRPDWDSLIHPEDFDPARLPRDVQPAQSVVTAADYVDAQNHFGGFIYAGGTMAFTAGYWALRHHRPKIMAFMGCDMTYDTTGPTHFYGIGTADPLRDDITLQSLEAKSARLMLIAARQGCAVVNLSRDPSRLVFPRGLPSDLARTALRPLDRVGMDAALARETEVGYMVPSGRYWEERDRFDAQVLREIDALWLAAAQATGDT